MKSINLALIVWLTAISVFNSSKTYAQAQFNGESIVITNDTIYLGTEKVGVEVNDQNQITLIFSSKNHKSNIGAVLKKDIKKVNESAEIILDVDEYLFYPSVEFIDKQIYINKDTVGSTEVKSINNSTNVYITITTRALDKDMITYVKKMAKAKYDEQFEDEFVYYYKQYDYSVEDKAQAIKQAIARKAYADKKRIEGDTASFPKGLFKLNTNDNKVSNHITYMNRALIAYNDYDLSKTKYWLDQAHQTGVTSGEYLWLLGWWCYDSDDEEAAGRYWKRAGNKYACLSCYELEEQLWEETLRPPRGK